MATKREGVSCYRKAGEDEELFVLRAQDQTMPYIIVEWIKANIQTAPRQKLIEALECARENLSSSEAD